MQYKCCKRYVYAEKDDVDDDDNDEADENVMPSTSGLSTSMWDVAVGKVEKLLKAHSTMHYLDFVKD